MKIQIKGDELKKVCRCDGGKPNCDTIEIPILISPNDVEMTKHDFEVIVKRYKDKYYEVCVEQMGF